MRLFSFIFNIRACFKGDTTTKLLRRNSEKGSNDSGVACYFSTLRCRFSLFVFGFLLPAVDVFSLVVLNFCRFVP